MEYLEPPIKKIKKNDIIVQYLSTDVVVAILALLPTKTLVKFRCVCRSWNFLVQEDAYFAAQHLKNSEKKSPSSVNLVCTDMNTETPEYMMHLRSYSGSKVREIDFRSVPNVYGMTNSCNGLVGVYTYDEFWVANPSIMKLAMLPRGTPHLIYRCKCLIPPAGIGFEASTGVYKVVRPFTRERKWFNAVSMGCEVFSLGGRSWKLVEDPPALARDYWFDSCSVVGGAVYWTVRFEVVGPGLMRPEIALAFDLRKEKFSALLHPEGNSRPEWSTVVAVGGRLCIVDMPLPHHVAQMNIWTLKDCRSSGWIKQHTIDLSKMQPSKGLRVGWVRPLTIDGWRIVLVSGVLERIYFDPATMRKVERINHGGRDGREFVSPYTESIVWPFGN